MKPLPIATLALCLVVASGVAAADRFQQERTIIVSTSGANRLDVDATLLSAAQALRYGANGAVLGGLDDLRLYDAAEREVPYLLIAPEQPAQPMQPGRVLPIAATKEESGFEVDLGNAVPVNRLDLDGLTAPFLKRLRLEGSGDRSHWTVLVDSGTAFDLPQENLKHTRIEFGAGNFQYLRVTWDDRNSAPIAPPRTASARIARPSAPPPQLSVPITFEKRAGEPGRSRFKLRLPGPRLPVVAIELNTAGGNLLRTARVSEPRLSGSTVVPTSLGSATLRRSVRDDVVAADLRIPIQTPSGQDLDLVVEDGSNPALELLSISVELAPLPWIFFESASGEALTARFGAADLRAPHYDLEALRDSVDGLALAEAHWGVSRDLGPPPTAAVSEGNGLPATGAAIDRSSFRYTRALPSGPPGLTAITLDAAVLAHSRGLADVRISDAGGHQVPYVVEELDEPLAVELDPMTPATEERENGISRYRLQLPYAGLPEAQLVLSTSARVFERRVTLQSERPAIDARSQPRPVIIAAASWQHRDPNEPAPALLLSLPSLPTTLAELTLDEGDNRPLPLARPQLLLPGRRLRCFRPDNLQLTLLYGHPTLAAPRYDLALLAAQLIGARAYEVTPAAEVTGEASGPSKPGTQSLLFWGALVVAVLVLLGIIVRLLAKGEATSDPKAGSSAS